MEKSTSIIVSEKPTDSVEKAKKPTTLPLVISTEIQTSQLNQFRKK